jgi:phytoene desaturase
VARGCTPTAWRHGLVVLPLSWRRGRPGEEPRVSGAVEHFDVVVIGAGVGGLVAAARLVLAGRRPLLMEAEPRLGGRFSTIEQGGYRLPTGAVAVETKGPFWDIFGELGIDPELRIPDPPVMIQVRGHDLRPGAALWQHMIKRVTKSAAHVAEGVARGRAGEEDEQQTLEEWVRRYTRSATVLSLFQSLSAAIFTVNADELPAGVFFRNLRETGGYKSFGFAPHGNVVVADALAAAIVERGGRVERGLEAGRIELADGVATRVHARGPDGVELSFDTDAVISNIGPRSTAKLVRTTSLEGAFADRVAGTETTSLLTLAFSSDEQIVPHPGIWAFTGAERLCNLANLGATCPELAPPGRSLYEAYSAPRPSVGGEFDVETERGLLEADLRRFVPAFERSEVILFKAMRGDRAPAQQARPGYDLPIETPAPNLLEVGDGVKPYGWIGTTACAETARIAVNTLLFNQPLGSQTGGRQ